MDYDAFIKATLAREELPLRDAYLKRARACLMVGKEKEGLQSIDAFYQAGRPKGIQEAEALELRGHEVHLFALQSPKADQKRLLGLALAELQHAVDKQRKSWSLFVDLGAVHQRLNNVNQALDCFAQALSLRPDDVRTLIRRGWLWEDLKEPDYEAACKDFARRPCVWIRPMPRPTPAWAT